MVGDHNGVGQGDTQPFLPAKTFAGLKPGYFFGQGGQGLGYVGPAALDDKSPFDLTPPSVVAMQVLLG